MKRSAWAAAVLIVSICAASASRAVALQGVLPEIPRLLVYNTDPEHYHSDPKCPKADTGKGWSAADLTALVKQGLKACPLCHPEKNAMVVAFFAQDPVPRALALPEGGDAARAAVDAVMTLRAAAESAPVVPR